MTRQTIVWALVFSAAATVCEAAEWRYKGPESSPAVTEQTASATESTDQAPVPTSADAASTAESQTAVAQPVGPMPTNNMVLIKVREQFGDPQEEIPAIGQPPILRWKYPNYITYFEVDRVIISVLLGQ